MNENTYREMVQCIGRDVSEYVQRTDSRFESEKNHLVEELSEAGILETVAIHEAGHEYYYKLAGISDDDMEFVPPVVRFYRERNIRPFDRQMAAIKVRDYHPDESDPDWFSKLAKGYAAGGECSVRLPALRRRRDGADLKAWKEACVGGYKGLHQSDEIVAIAQKMWADAQKAIRDDLNDSALRDRIQRRATEITPQLFPWLRS